LDFEDVSALTLHAGSHLVKSVFRVLAQDGLARTEADFGLVRSLVLVDVADHGLNVLDASGDLLRGLLRRSGLVAGVDGVLVGFIGLVGSEFNARLRTRVDVFDLLGVGRGQFVEFVNAVTDRFSLPLYIFLAGERIHASPEALTRGRSQRRFASGVAGAGISRTGLSLRGGLVLVLGRRGGLRKGRHRKHSSQWQGNNESVIHI